MKLFLWWSGGTSQLRLSGDITGVLGHGVENTIALASSSFEIVGFQGEAMANFHAIGVSQGDVAPPGAVIVPEMMIRVQGATGDKLEVCGGHDINSKLVF